MPLDKPRPKTPKRVMEKKRRARINESLIELKNIVLQAMNRNNPRHSKLEKADILEMTVKYLRGVHGRHATGKVPVTSDTSSQYRSGYTECMREVQTFLNNSDASSSVRLRLLDHLSRSCVLLSSPPSTTALGMGPPRQSNTFKPTCDIQPMNPPLTACSLPILLSQVASPHSAKSVSLASDTVQSSIQATHINSPPKAMNIQLPVGLLSKVPIPTLSLSPPSIPLSSPSIPPPPPPPLLSSSSSLKKELSNTDTVGLSLNTQEMGQLTNQVSGGLLGSNVIGNLPTNDSYPGVIRMSTTQEGDVTVVLPQSALPGGKLPTHLIPVYEPSANNVRNVSNVGDQGSNIAVMRSDTAVPSVSQITTTIPCSIPLPNSSSSPRAAAVAPLAWYTRPAFLTANVEQGHSVFAQTPVTITLPFQARIVQNLIPMQTASISSIVPGHVNHIPVRFANSNNQALEEDDFMWRPW